MKKKKKNIIIAIIILLIISIIAIILIQYNKTQEVNEPIIKISNKTDEDILVIDINKQEQNQTEQNNTTEPEPEKNPEPEKDAATLTQNLYNMNSEIGTLYIPKTKLNIQVYSNPDPQKMEKMPVILYTSGGLNQNGVTLIVGHNRRNGKIFSKNKKLSEGDVFYFTDYEGNQREYVIYSKFITTSDDTSFLNTDADAPIIALSCCTDASDDNRIIILGRAD